MPDIKSSKHSITFANKTKIDNLNNFIDEYRRVATIIVDDIWNNGYTYNNQEFNIHKNLLTVPKFIDYNKFNFKTTLTARALSTLVTQISGMLSAEVEKQRKRIWMLQHQKELGSTKQQRKQLALRLKQNIPQKPNCNNINVEVSSKCCDWLKTNGLFDGYLRLKSIKKTKTEIKIPIKFHKHSNHLMQNREMMSSFLISKNNITIRWKKEKQPIKQDGVIVGCDQGMKDVLNCSDKQVTPKIDIHGHSLESIIRKLSTKKKGSKAFKRAQEHRKNFINWSINQLNFSGIKEVRLERIWNICYKNRTNRLMPHWSNTLIRDKIESKCAEEGIRLIHQSSTYRSQRCSGCGIVRKTNRKGKVYECKHCGLVIDADYNASKNHEIDLPEIPYFLRKLQLNRSNGFYWLETGFYDFATGRSIESLPQVEDK